MAVSERLESDESGPANQALAAQGPVDKKGFSVAEWMRLISGEQELNSEGETEQAGAGVWEEVEIEDRAGEDENAKRGPTQELAHEDGTGTGSRAEREGEQARVRWDWKKLTDTEAVAVSRSLHV